MFLHTWMKKFYSNNLPSRKQKSSLQLLCSGAWGPPCTSAKVEGCTSTLWSAHPVASWCHPSMSSLFLVSQNMSRRHRHLSWGLWSPQCPASSAVPSRTQYTHPNWYRTQAGRFPLTVHSLPADSKSMDSILRICTCVMISTTVMWIFISSILPGSLAYWICEFFVQFYLVFLDCDI